jgi:hypothetical protein
MRNALEIPEIAHTIIDQHASSRKTLLSLALTHTSFTNHSLDLIWIDADLFDLATLMPESLIEITKDKKGKCYVRIDLSDASHRR